MKIAMPTVRLSIIALTLACALASAADPKPAPHTPTAADLYGPIPAATIKAILADHGLPPTLYTIVRRIPLELGGTNAKDNLMVISLHDLPEKLQFEAIVLQQVRRNQVRVEQARKDVAAWEPAR